jgi:crossover junction endodeoxyribonuclease RusA
MTVIELPMPPSTNNLFINVGRRRTLSPEYRAWREEAGWRLAAQRPLAIPGKVSLDIAIEDTGRLDLDNTLKGCIDLLVHHKVIEGDSRKYVRDIRAHWSKDVTGCRIEIWEAA